MADWLEVTAAVVAVNVAVVAPGATVTEVGTVSAAVALLDNATLVPPVGAAFEIVTVHVVLEDAAGVVLPHCKEVTVATVKSERLAVTLTPFRAPVTVADWLAVDPAVAVKVALDALAAIDTVAGTVIPAVELKATVVGETAGLLNVMVQVAAAPGARDAGAHESPLSELTITFAAPAVALVTIWLPSDATAMAPETWTGTEVTVLGQRGGYVRDNAVR